jgi:hypothetical protein
MGMPTSISSGQEAVTYSLGYLSGDPAFERLVRDSSRSAWGKKNRSGCAKTDVIQGSPFSNLLGNNLRSHICSDVAERHGAASHLLSCRALTNYQVNKMYSAQNPMGLWAVLHTSPVA